MSSDCRRCVLCGAPVRRAGPRGPHPRVCRDGDCAREQRRAWARKWYRTHRGTGRRDLQRAGRAAG
jgi:hypothetical protein